MAYIKIDSSSGPVYFQESPAGLQAVSDPATLRGLMAGTILSTAQTQKQVTSQGGDVFATTPAPSAPSGSTTPSPSPVVAPVSAPVDNSVTSFAYPGGTKTVEWNTKTGMYDVIMHGQYEGKVSESMTGARAESLFPNVFRYAGKTAPTYTPSVTPIGSPVNPPTAGGLGDLTLPTPQADLAYQSYFESYAKRAQDQTALLETTFTSYQNQLKEQLAAAQKSYDDIRTLQEEGVLQYGQATQDEKRRILTELSDEKARWEENYNANQLLVNELKGLLTTGQDLIKQQQGVTGLASMRNPRIQKTIQDVTAQAGVIQAVITARMGQMGEARAQLSSAASVIQAAFQDELDYYKTLYNFYESQASVEGTKLIKLTDAEQDFVKTKIDFLEGQVKRVQDNADYIQKLLVDPSTALLMSLAGVKLTDTPEQVNTKLAQATYEKQSNELINKETTGGNSVYLATEAQQSQYPKEQLYTTYDSKGVPMVFWKKPEEKVVQPGSTDSKNTILSTDQYQKLQAIGVSPDLADKISTAILAGHSLEDIRAEMRNQNIDTKTLDAFDNVVGIATLLKGQNSKPDASKPDALTEVRSSIEKAKTLGFDRATAVKEILTTNGLSSEADIPQPIKDILDQVYGPATTETKTFQWWNPLTWF